MQLLDLLSLPTAGGSPWQHTRLGSGGRRDATDTGQGRLQAASRSSSACCRARAGIIPPDRCSDCRGDRSPVVEELRREGCVTRTALQRLASAEQERAVDHRRPAPYERAHVVCGDRTHATPCERGLWGLGFRAPTSLASAVSPKRSPSTRTSVTPSPSSKPPGGRSCTWHPL